MGVILRHFIDDISVTLKQTFDDKMIQRSQVAYWTLLVANTLKSQHILKRSSGAFLVPFRREILIDSITGMKYFILPTTIYDFNNDRGIDCIYYVSDGSPLCPPQFTKQTFTRTTRKISERLYYSRYEVPSPKAPFFYRINERIYTLGIEKVNIKFVDVDLFTALDPLSKIDIDQVLDFPDETMAILRRNVMDLARYSYIFPQDKTNDGNDSSTDKPVNLPKTSSVNDQLTAD